jgi:hypothetical protein
LLDAGYLPSLWRTQRISFRLLLLAVIGPLAVDALLRADANVHRRLADARRKRRPDMPYPLRR